MLYVSECSFCLLVLSVFLHLISLTKKSSIGIFKEQAFFIFSSFSDLFQCMYFVVVVVLNV